MAFTRQVCRNLGAVADVLIEQLELQNKNERRDSICAQGSQTNEETGDSGSISRGNSSNGTNSKNNNTNKNKSGVRDDMSNNGNRTDPGKLSVSDNNEKEDRSDTSGKEGEKERRLCNPIEVVDVYSQQVLNTSERRRIDSNNTGNMEGKHGGSGTPSPSKYTRCRAGVDPVHTLNNSLNGTCNAEASLTRCARELSSTLTSLGAQHEGSRNGTLKSGVIPDGKDAEGWGGSGMLGRRFTGGISPSTSPAKQQGGKGGDTKGGGTPGMQKEQRMGPGMLGRRYGARGGGSSLASRGKQQGGRDGEMKRGGDTWKEEKKRGVVNDVGAHGPVARLNDVHKGLVAVKEQCKVMLLRELDRRPKVRERASRCMISLFFRKIWARGGRKSFSGSNQVCFWSEHCELNVLYVCLVVLF